MTAIIEPRPPSQRAKLAELNEAPPPGMQAPEPSGNPVFRPSSEGSLEAQLERFISQPNAVQALATNSAFTADDLERKNQERVSAFVSGPSLPTGEGGGQGAMTLQPTILAPWNRERLNAGTPVIPSLSNPRVRALGNDFGTRVQSNTWATIAQVMTGQATVDPAGFAQVNHNGTMIAAEPTTQHLERGRRPGGPLYGADNQGGINSGAGFTKQDGAGAGAVANAALAVAQRTPPAFAYAPPPGRGALEVPKAYGLSALI